MKMTNNIASGVVIVALLVGASFYAGMTYGKKSVAPGDGPSGSQGGQNFQRGQRGSTGQPGGPQGGSRQGSSGPNMGDFAGGQIISKDDTSVTIKTRDGGTKIIFLSGSTGIDKSVSGSSSDLAVGQQIMVNGKSNPDGSIAAQSIQIRPTDQNNRQNQ